LRSLQPLLAFDGGGSGCRKTLQDAIIGAVLRFPHGGKHAALQRYQFGLNRPFADLLRRPDFPRHLLSSCYAGHPENERCDQPARGGTPLEIRGFNQQTCQGIERCPFLFTANNLAASTGGVKILWYSLPKQGGLFLSQISLLYLPAGSGRKSVKTVNPLAYPREKGIRRKPVPGNFFLIIR